uniref:Peptidase_M14 domain-containing protein n=1 Tax=Parastrongyloides trichosuri TaxID=131310 RepID=A0A0N4ZDP5_PARTI
MVSLLLFLFSLTSFLLHGHVSNKTGYVMYDVRVRNKNDINIYEALRLNFPYNIDYFFRSRKNNEKVKIFVSQSVSSKLELFLKSHNYKYRLTRNKVGDKSYTHDIYKIRRSLDYGRLRFNHTNYNSYNEIISYMKYVSTEYREFISLHSLGYSHENRPIYYLRIGYNNKGIIDKPLISIDANIHAREWISSTSALHIINNLINERKKYDKILRTMHIDIIPILNPDGYEFSRNFHRLWRGNRNIRDNKCGVDLNRNYPFDWNDKLLKCETFPGIREKSEKETIYHVQYLLANKMNMKAYVTLHSAGNKILFPWGNTRERRVENHYELESLAQNMSKAMNRIRNSIVTFGQSSKELYETKGSSDDYAKSLGVRYVYTIELSDLSDGVGNAFIVPTDKIKVVSDEAFEGIMTIINKIYYDFHNTQ